MKCLQKLKILNSLSKFIKEGKIDLPKIKINQANQLFSKKICETKFILFAIYWLIKLTRKFKLSKIIKVINF